MKANRGLRPILVLAAATLATLLASCSEPRVVPQPTPSPTPRPSPPPLPPRPIAQDWRAAPITPGDWTWAMEGGQSVARFAGGLLTIRCDRARGTITLLRAGAGTPANAGPEPMTVTTTSGMRTLSAVPQGGSVLAVALTPGDPVLDAMIFSRGRFVIETPGTGAIYVPSWSEVSRVTEDCR
jgi:hypothetical protein